MGDDEKAMVDRKGVLLVVSGPSGSGKTTLCRATCDRDDGCVHSISCTTRAPRPGERDGIDYFFLSEEGFGERVDQGEFLEHARVHGRRYGTLRRWVTDQLALGRDVLMDIDVQGAAQVRESTDPSIVEALIDVFVLPPSVRELEQRLANRATEDEGQLRLRLENALTEMAEAHRYRYTIISGSREEDLERFEAILHAARCRTSRQVLPPFARPPIP